MANDTGTVDTCMFEYIDLNFFGIPGPAGEMTRHGAITFYTNDPANPEIIWDITMNVDPSTRLERTTSHAPESYIIHPNFPNPFNSSTVFNFYVPSTASVEFNIYDILGKKIKTVLNGIASPGWHRNTWDGKDETGWYVASGIYIYQLISGGDIYTGKILLVR